MFHLLAKAKPDFTPLRPAGRRSVNVAGLMSGGSGPSLLSCCFFLLVGGGGELMEKRKDRREGLDCGGRQAYNEVYSPSMFKPRLKKFVRAEVADPLKLQPRDIALLRNAVEFRFLNTPQIFALHPGGKRNLSRRLTALYQHDYLDRLQSQTSARLLSSHIVYALGRRGTELLSKDAEGARRDLSPSAG